MCKQIVTTVSLESENTCHTYWTVSNIAAMTTHLHQTGQGLS